ncbi:nuclear transport factor 2 family protein [Bradyrhizobium diazoefficiens]|uniref:nuclear transport factor 2 family protein n=1 Tax=Bradyrhizobium diazoefficiens TaxID=1355477 RepID=UPI00384C9036
MVESITSEGDGHEAEPVHDLVESGGTVWARRTATGTHTRSGKPIRMTVIDICRFENGKLVEH